MHQLPAALSADTARAEIDALYTPLDEALAQLRERRINKNLRAAVTEFYGMRQPQFLVGEPRAILWRDIITPDREFEHFASTVAPTGLLPLCLEYSTDILCTHNNGKYRMCRPLFEVRPNHFRGLRIMNFGQMDGQRLCDLRLKNDMPLPEFHHTLLHYAFPEMNAHLHDFSEWFNAVRREDFYYLHYLALFICDGILFENFFANDPEELRFARERAIPSFTKAVELFGVRPLIVPLLPRETENEDSWCRHVGSLYPEALRLLRQKA